MGNDRNINPLEDIDFEALGIMVKEDDPPAQPESSKEEDPPGTPPADDPPRQDDPPSGSSEEDDDPPPKEDQEDDDPADPPKVEKEEEEDDPPPEKGDPEPSLISELVELVGYEDIDPEQYEDNVEGLGKFIQDASGKLASQQWEGLLSQHPEVKEFYDFVASGGDPDVFHQVRGQARDYESTQIDEDDETMQERLVRDALSLNEYEKEEIDGMVEKYKAGGILKDQADLALKGLKRFSSKQKEEITRRQTEMAKEQQAKVQEFWGNVKSTLSEKDSFNDIQIPKKEKDPFFDYISKPVKDGYTQRDLDALEMGLEQKLAIDYLLFKKLNFEKIIDRKAASKQAASLRERIRSGPGQKPRKGHHPKPPGEKGEVNTDNLDLI